IDEQRLRHRKRLCPLAVVGQPVRIRNRLLRRHLRARPVDLERRSIWSEPRLQQGPSVRSRLRAHAERARRPEIGGQPMLEIGRDEEEAAEVGHQCFCKPPSAASTSSLWPSGLTPMNTLAILPSGSTRKVLRAASLCPWYSNTEPYSAETFASGSERSL